jgi:hypothetical protein
MLFFFCPSMVSLLVYFLDEILHLNRVLIFNFPSTFLEQILKVPPVQLPLLILCPPSIILSFFFICFFFGNRTFNGLAIYSLNFYFQGCFLFFGNYFNFSCNYFCSLFKGFLSFLLQKHLTVLLSKL